MRLMLNKFFQARFTPRSGSRDSAPPASLISDDNPETSYSNRLKVRIIVVGRQGVGKSALVDALCGIPTLYYETKVRCDEHGGVQVYPRRKQCRDKNHEKNKQLQWVRLGFLNAIVHFLEDIFVGFSVTRYQRTGDGNELLFSSELETTSDSAETQGKHVKSDKKKSDQIEEQPLCNACEDLQKHHKEQLGQTTKNYKVQYFGPDKNRIRIITSSLNHDENSQIETEEQQFSQAVQLEVIDAHGMTPDGNCTSFYQVDKWRRQSRSHASDPTALPGSLPDGSDPANHEDSEKPHDVVEMFLYVTQLDDCRADQTERVCMRALTRIFGHRMWYNSMLIFTNGWSVPPAGLSYAEYARGRRDMLITHLRSILGTGERMLSMDKDNEFTEEQLLLVDRYWNRLNNTYDIDQIFSSPNPNVSSTSEPITYGDIELPTREELLQNQESAQEIFEELLEVKAQKLDDVYGDLQRLRGVELPDPQSELATSGSLETALSIQVPEILPPRPFILLPRKTPPRNRFWMQVNALAIVETREACASRQILPFQTSSWLGMLKHKVLNKAREIQRQGLGCLPLVRTLAQRDRELGKKPWQRGPLPFFPRFSWQWCWVVIQVTAVVLIIAWSIKAKEEAKKQRTLEEERVDVYELKVDGYEPETPNDQTKVESEKDLRLKDKEIMDKRMAEIMASRRAELYEEEDSTSGLDLRDDEEDEEDDELTGDFEEFLEDLDEPE